MKFMNKIKICVLISCAVILLGIVVGLFTGGLNLGIDFTGGSLLTVELGAEYNEADINAALEANGIDPATSQIVKSGTQAIIRMQELPADMDDAQVREAVIAKLQETYPEANADNIESVGGATTGEIIYNAFMSVVIACGLMLVYIWIRFELFSGIAAVIGLIHDVLIMTSVMCIARVQINSSYIAAVLTIVGYSINDTIVVYDRIRENFKKYGLKTKTRADIVDISITETIPRTINTSATTLITILAVYIFGVPSIKEFALPIIVGLISGTYSSIFISSPIWIGLQEARDKRHKLKMHGGAKPKKKKA